MLYVLNNQVTLSPGAVMSTSLYGLYANGSSTGIVYAYYNSVVLGGGESGTRSSWAGLRQGGSTQTTCNNLFLNFRTGGTGSHFAAGLYTTGGTYTASNNVYAGTGAAVPANFMDSAGFGWSLASWQSSGMDASSQGGVAGSGGFTSAMFVDAPNGDLHLVPGGNPLVNATGVPVAGVSVDYDGDLRSSTTPSIGADEAVAATGIAAWRQQYFGSSANSGNAADTADYDHDGLPNLIEWACNLNPTTASRLPAGAVVNGGNLEFDYTRSLSALNAGAVFSVEWSDTLANAWQGSGVGETILSDDGTVQQVKATLPAGSTGRRFVHLKVTAPP